MAEGKSGPTIKSKSGCGCFGGGFTVGGVVAFIISWKLWHSIGWAIVAALFGWAYVLYAMFNYWAQIKAWLG